MRLEAREGGGEESRGRPGGCPEHSPSSGAAWLGPWRAGEDGRQVGSSQRAEGEMTGRREGEWAGELQGLLKGPPSWGGAVALRVVEAQRGAFSHLSNNSPSFYRGGKAGLLSAYTVGFLPTPPCDARVAITIHIV